MRLYRRGMALFSGLLCLLGMLSPSVSAQEVTITVSAASAILMEADSGRILYQKDAHTPRPMASTTKIMTALLAVERLDWERDITVPAQAVQVEGTALGLRGGDTISAKDLVTGMMLTSGNDAANAIAWAVAGGKEAFVALMNQRAARIGMTHTTFVTPSGLDEGDHSSTAYDMALLAREALKNERLAAIVAMESATIHLGDPKRAVTVSNHNRLLKLYPDAIGIKTGFTKKAGRCLVSAAKREGVTFVAVTLNCPDDWDDHTRMYDAAFSRVDSHTLPPVSLPDLPVAGGEEKSLSLTADPPPTLSLLKGDGDRVVTRLELPAFVWGGVKRGDTVGRVRYCLDGRELAALPVTAAEDVAAQPVAGYTEQAGRLFLRLLEGLLTW